VGAAVCPMMGTMPPEATVARDDGALVCERCSLANTPLRRLKGLLGRRSLPPGEGMLITPAPAVHTWFMRFPIDVVFLDRESRVVGVAAELKPWRWARGGRARAAMELAAGEAARRGVRTGQRLTVNTGPDGSPR
jgi:uncharacterized protein